MENDFNDFGKKKEPKKFSPKIILAGLALVAVAGAGLYIGDGSLGAGRMVKQEAPESSNHGSDLAIVNFELLNTVANPGSRYATYQTNGGVEGVLEAQFTVENVGSDIFNEDQIDEQDYRDLEWQIEVKDNDGSVVWSSGTVGGELLCTNRDGEIIRDGSECAEALTIDAGEEVVRRWVVGEVPGSSSAFWQPTRAGEYTAEVCIDHRIRIESEASSQGNNCAELNLVVIDPPKPDFVIENLEILNSSNYVVGGNIDVQFDVVNVGAADASGDMLDGIQIAKLMYKKGHPHGNHMPWPTFEATFIPAGNSESFNYSFTAPVAVEFNSIWACADTDYEILEENEENNCAEAITFDVN